MERERMVIISMYAQGGKNLDENLDANRIIEYA